MQRAMRRARMTNTDTPKEVIGALIDVKYLRKWRMKVVSGKGNKQSIEHKHLRK
jgi:hypothetical protein